MRNSSYYEKASNAYDTSFYHNPNYLSITSYTNSSFSFKFYRGFIIVTINGLAPNGRHAISWNNTGSWLHYKEQQSIIYVNATISTEENWNKYWNKNPTYLKNQILNYNRFLLTGHVSYCTLWHCLRPYLYT